MVKIALTVKSLKWTPGSSALTVKYILASRGNNDLTVQRLFNLCLSRGKQISLLVGGRPLMYKASNISRWHFSQKDDRSRSRAKYHFASKLTFYYFILFLNYQTKELKYGSGNVFFF